MEDPSVEVRPIVESPAPRGPHAVGRLDDLHIGETSSGGQLNA